MYNIIIGLTQQQTREKSKKIHCTSYLMITNWMSIILDSIGGQALALRRSKYILLGVYKCIKKLNAHSFHNLVNSNTMPFQLKTSKLEQPLHRTTRYGLRTFSCVGSHLRNFKWLWWYSLNRFQLDQGSFKYIEGSGYFPACDTSTLAISLQYCINIFLYVLMWTVFLFYPTTVYSVTALYIFTPYSRILAFWLMLFVYHATLNKALSYFILSYIILS